MSTSVLPVPSSSIATQRTASKASLHIKSLQVLTNFVPIEDLISAIISSVLFTSTGLEMSWTICKASSRAFLKALIITMGWMLFWMWGNAPASTSPASVCVCQCICLALHFKLVFLTENNDTGGAIANLFILCSGKFNHTLGGRMVDFDFTKDGVTIVCQ